MLDGPLWVRFRSFHFRLGRFHDSREMARLKGQLMTTADWYQGTQLIEVFVALPKNAIAFQLVAD